MPFYVNPTFLMFEVVYVSFFWLTSELSSWNKGIYWEMFPPDCSFIDFSSHEKNSFLIKYWRSFMFILHALLYSLQFWICSIKYGISVIISLLSEPRFDDSGGGVGPPKLLQTVLRFSLICFYWSFWMIYSIPTLLNLLLFFYYIYYDDS